MVGCGRRRRCSIANGSRSGSVRDSGGCLVRSGRRRRCSIVIRRRSGSVKGSGGFLVERIALMLGASVLRFLQGILPELFNPNLDVRRVTGYSPKKAFSNNG